LPTPDRVGRYRIERELGRGGMGVVYAGHDDQLQRPVAIKTIMAGQADERQRKRFLREARAAARIRHPNVCHLYEISEEADGPFIVMELLEGESLAARLGRGPLAVTEAIAITDEILSALSALHGQHVVHRDLKPSNIFLTSHGVKLLDFGLAREVQREGEGTAVTTESQLTQAGAVVGTPSYMAPEQLQGQRTDPRTDLFALGAVLFEMLTAKRAFGGQSLAEIYHQTLYEQPPALSGSEAVREADKVIRRALAKRPEGRFPTAVAMAEALQAAKAAEDAGEELRAHPVTRLMVLPFRMLRPDEETDFLAFAVPDAVTAALMGLEGLVVRSSALASGFAGETLDLKRIGEEADVDVVLTGTLLRAGDRIRASVQLLQVDDGTVVWSHAPQVGMRDVFDLQDQIVERIVNTLTLSLTAREHQRLKNDVPATSTAYELFLRANQLLAAQGLVNLADQKVARDLYTRAVEEDPRYAPAWARLGRCHWLLAKGGEDRDYNVARAEECFKRALELSPDLPLAHNLYALLEIDEGRAQEAMVRLVRRGVSGNAQPEMFGALVAACRYCGLLEASVAAHERARALDRNIMTSVAQTYWRMGDEERALAVQKGIFLMDVLLSAEHGEKEEALRLIAERLASKELPEMVRTCLTAAKAIVEERPQACVDAARWWFDNLRDPEALYFMARLVAAVGANELALAQLKRSLEGGYILYRVLVREDPWLDGLRSTEEFQALVARSKVRYEEALGAFVDAGGPQLLGIQVTGTP
jgi:TolB-like protein